MSDCYAITLEKEVLCEFASIIDARYSRYMQEHGIDFDDETNILALNMWETVRSKREMLHCETLEELMVFEKRLKELRNEIESKEEEEKCQKNYWRSALKASSQ